jgi:GNAT superfamily N-acetyltransferase
MDVRPVVDADLPAVAKIALANGDVDAAADPGYVSHLRHVGSFLVAELDREPAGYCAARRAGGVTMLCDLFVDPARHGTGVGGRLLGAVLADARECFTFASRDPRAMPLYIRHGMFPRWPLLYLSGPATDSATLRPERVPMAEAAATELALTGADRSADYSYWAAAPGGTGLIVRDGGEVVAAGAATADRLIHLAAAADHDPVAPLIGALAAFESGRVRLCLPGPHPALPLLLNARWRIDDLDQHMSSVSGLLSPHQVPSPSLG